MPLQSREVVTLRLILDSSDEPDDSSEPDSQSCGHLSPLLRLPAELRLKILRYLLRIDRNRKPHTRRPPPEGISDLLWLHSHRILDAPPFKHKGAQEINGCPPVINTCQLHPAILRTCSRLYWEGKAILYAENKVVGLQSGIKGLVAKFRNYGIPSWGPLPASRLLGTEDLHTQYNVSKFDPVMLFSGQNAKNTTPFYICSYKDSADFIHALWIMIKSSYARGMKYKLTLSAEPRHRYVNRTDSFVKFAVLPWLHNHITKVDFNKQHITTLVVEEAETKAPTVTKRLGSIRNELIRHVALSQADPNLYTYNTICGYLEQVLSQAEICVDQTNFLSAELLYERVHYEACSMIRTRTAKLVDVSDKSKDGINRVCKLIAISAYRLCELRSGSLARLIVKDFERMLARQEAAAKHNREDAPLGQKDRFAKVEETSTNVTASTPGLKLEHKLTLHRTVELPPGQCNTAKYVVPARLKAPFVPRTTRLDSALAKDLALASGLLALRLPCASPLHEWSIRVDIMLLRLFVERNDSRHAAWTVRRIKDNCSSLWEDAKGKTKSTQSRWQALNDLVTYLDAQLSIGPPRMCFFTVADKCQAVVAGLWGDRLVPKKAYIGLIWTFRWAN